MNDWTTPEAIRAHLLRLWESGRLLAERETAYPLSLPLRQPGAAQLGERFDEVRAWIRALEAGGGYEIVWREINHRQLGRNRVPERIVIHRFDDAVALIGRQQAVRRFDQLRRASLARFPALAGWIARHPLPMLERAAEWERVLACLDWFTAHPRSGLYLRQLDISDVDTKFIETRKALLAELLDAVLDPAAIDSTATGAKQFERRYGLRGRPAVVRFRLLDPMDAIAGLTDLAVPVDQFARLDARVERVYITENEINGLAFPAAANALVIFGGGYGVERLAAIGWLREREVLYWGDIDTHGFAILDRLRASLPHARSLLMDMATLQAHQALWGREDKDKRFGGALARLSEAEGALFEALRHDSLGERVRLEQERIPFGWVEAAVRAL